MSEDRKPPETDDQIVARFWLGQLKSRHPDWDWDGSKTRCPDCGSMAHFECDGSGKA